MTGPLGSSALEPRASFAVGASGTPKRMTDLRPFATSGVRYGTTLFRPRRWMFGSEGMSVSSSGWSDTKRG